MRKYQRTIKYQTQLAGTGLHTGNKTTVSFRPAPPNTGVRFLRTDLAESPEIPADIDHVMDISRGTTLGIGEVKVHTVEHVLAAVAGLEIDNLYVEINGNEPPVGDGSAKPFVDTLLKAEFEEQNAVREYLVIEDTVHYKDEAKKIDIVALPTDDFRITLLIDYNYPALGSQHSGLFSLEKEFVPEFAPARTFCFLTEVEELWEKGLIRGGSLHNALVIVDRDLSRGDLRDLGKKFKTSEKLNPGDNGILNGIPLRFKNEFVRHKLLDMIGDLSLVGVPLKAQILAARAGHRANIEFVKTIRNLYKKKKVSKKQHVSKTDGIVYDVNAIKRILPHRYPFLLVDRVVDIEVEKKIVGIKNVTVSEPFFQGHFPARPVMPGVLIVEAMAQVGGLLAMHSIEKPDGKLVYFMGIDKVKFRKPVVPGDQIRFEVELLKRKRSVVVMSGKAYVDDKLVCEGEFMATIAEKEE